MINTILGQVEIMINGQRTDYQSIELSSVEVNFKVDKRYKIIININEYWKEKYEKIIVECVLKQDGRNLLERCVESGEIGNA